MQKIITLVKRITLSAINLLENKFSELITIFYLKRESNKIYIGSKLSQFQINRFHIMLLINNLSFLINTC